jgi:hypothetical protein
VAQGDYIGAGVCVVSGAVDLFTMGTASTIISTAQEVSKTTAKEASIQATKEAVK